MLNAAIGVMKESLLRHTKMMPHGEAELHNADRTEAARTIQTRDCSLCYLPYKP
jgi:hypothetical protein